MRLAPKTITRAFSSTPRISQQFLLIAKDYSDAGALERRFKVRQNHLDRARQSKLDGNVLVGGATLSSTDEAVAKMNGSMLVLEFPTLADAEAYVKADPYVTGKVWESWTLTPFKMAPLPPSKQ
ncbi:hypothetical protein HDU79_006681 [Rhizoclosmatium sp. JEL0117]|nr:hypothetical protein HDU79_006681 [Rhizoclosmatium sp. JEL0117]